MRYDRFCAICQRDGRVCVLVPTYRACLHDVPEGDPCARCDDMRLADVPAPKTPAIGRRVLRAPEHAPGFALADHDRHDRVALVHPDVARHAAVIQTALRETPSAVESLAALAESYEYEARHGAERASAAGDGESKRHHETGAAQSGAAAAVLRACCGLGALGADVIGSLK